MRTRNSLPNIDTDRHQQLCYGCTSPASMNPGDMHEVDSPIETQYRPGPSTHVEDNRESETEQEISEDHQEEASSSKETSREVSPRKEDDEKNSESKEDLGVESWV